MATPATTMAGKVLEGVPHIGFHTHLCPFPGSLYAYLQFTGNPTDYDYLMGTSGASFRRLFNRDDGGNVDLSHLLERPYQQVFRALGYRWHFEPMQKEGMIAAIRKCIDRGVPVISFGIIGPPEAGLVTGYAEDGEVLYGWSYFQEDGERYYEKRAWFEAMESMLGHAWHGLLVIDERLPLRPSERATLADSLRWAIELERTQRWPNLPDHVGGLAAYDAWAAALEVDADYPPNDDKVMSTRCMIYGDQVTMLEERKSAARYLRQMSAVAPESAAALNAAADAYQAAGEHVALLWPWGYASNDESRVGLENPVTRRELAKLVRSAGAKEADGVKQLEVALAEMRA
jgi:hypothetical protein